MKNILEDIGKFLDISRIYIFLNRHQNVVSNTFEWCNKGVTPQIDELQNVKYTDVPSWIKMLEEKGLIYTKDIENLPRNIVKKLKEQDIKSILVYPLIIEKEIKGFIGFDECRYKRKWKEQELEILSTVSGIVANTYERKFYQEDISVLIKRLKENEKRFDLALNKTKAGLWDYDLKNGDVFLSPMWKNILGYRDDEIENSFSSWEKLWHPEDREKIRKAIDDYLVGKSKDYEIIHRLKHKDGYWRWILTRGGTLYNSEGNPYRWIGTNIDITKEQDQSLEFERFFAVNLDLLCISDMEGNFIKTNKAWEDILGYSSDELEGQKLFKFVYPEDIESTLNCIKNLKKDEEITQFVNRYMKKEGGYRYIEWRAKAYEGTIYGSGRDVTAHIEYEKKILELSNRDTLTNLYNRRYIFERGEEIIEEYKRTESKFSVCIIDIDEFKMINDEYGHQTGDAVLKEFTKIMQENLRPYDILGRYGGEEFVIILKNIDLDQSFLVIDRVRKIIKDKKFVFYNRNINFTFSAGIVNSKEIKKDKLNMDNLFEIADKRMYYAKNTGKNKIVYDYKWNENICFL